MMTYCIPMSLLCPDSKHWGRLNYESLSQQALMEIVVESAADKTSFHDDSGNYKDVCLWDGIKCNEREEVISIGGHCNYFHYNGKLNFDFLPMSVEMVHMFDDSDYSIDVDLTKLPSMMVMFSVDHCTPQQINVAKLSPLLVHFYVRDSHLTGTLPTDGLPSGLCVLGLARNSLFGTVNLETLPHSLKILDLSTNKFTGNLRILRLPKFLREMLLGRNQFHGNIDLSNLPGGIGIFGIEQNKIIGTIDLSYFPDTLSGIDLGGNSLEGSIRLRDLPIATSLLALHKNRLSGEVSLRGLTHARMRELYLEDNQFYGSIDLTELPQRLRIMHIFRNKFSGTLDFGRLPDALEELNLSDNFFTGIVDVKVVPERLRLLDVGRNNFLSESRIGKLLYRNGDLGSRDEEPVTGIRK